MRKLTVLLAALLIIPAAAVQAQETADADVERSWIHVHVQEDGEDKVEINLPLRLVDVAIEANDAEEFAGDFHLGEKHGVSVEELRRVWNELRDAGDVEFVNVRDGDEKVRVYRRGDRVHLDVDEDGEKKVRVELPSRVVDALLSGRGERLDLSAAAREMAKLGDEQIVQIDDEGSRVRVWVDRKSGTAGS